MATILNFTKAALDTLELPTDGQRAEYKDAKQPCLRLRVSYTGVKTFCVFKRIKGAGMERITLARYPEMTIEQARKKTAEIIGKIAEGDNPAETRRSIRAEPTFKDLFAEYELRHAQTKRSWKADAQRYRDYLEPTLGHQKISAITTPMISKILSDMTRLGKENATVNNVRALASSIFNKGIEWGMASSNPVSATKTLKKRQRDRFLQSHELPRFFISLLQEPNEMLRDYFLLSLLTGARRANVLAMRWREVSLTDRVWRIPRTKNDDPQNVPLGDEAIQVLQRLKKRADAQAEFVFPGEGGSGHLVEPKKGWKRIFDRDELHQLVEMIETAGAKLEPLKSKITGQERYETLESRLERARALATQLNIPVENVRIPDLRIHDLRRTLGSWQAITGASLPIIGKSLNHKSPLATAIYARLDLDPVRASVGKATNAMLQAAGIQNLGTIGDN
jgi:integrase